MFSLCLYILSLLKRTVNNNANHETYIRLFPLIRYFLPNPGRILPDMAIFQDFNLEIDYKWQKLKYAK